MFQVAISVLNWSHNLQGILFFNYCELCAMLCWVLYKYLHLQMWAHQHRDTLEVPGSRTLWGGLVLLEMVLLLQAQAQQWGSFSRVKAPCQSPAAEWRDADLLPHWGPDPVAKAQRAQSVICSHCLFGFPRAFFTNAAG